MLIFEDGEKLDYTPFLEGKNYISMSDEVFEAVSNLKDFNYECYTVPVSYGYYCSTYKNGITKEGRDVKKTFLEIIDGSSVSFGPIDGNKPSVYSKYLLENPKKLSNKNVKNL